MRARVVPAMVVLLGGLACGGGGTTADPSPSATGTLPTLTSTARLTIVEPQPGAKLSLQKAPVKVTLEDARVIPDYSTDLRPDTGHLHISYDGQTLSFLAGEEVDLVVLARESKPPVELTPGQHLLQVEFVMADHRPFNPRVVATTTFVLK